MKKIIVKILIGLFVPALLGAAESDSFQDGLRKIEKQEGELSVIEWFDDNSKAPALIQKFDGKGNLVFESEHRSRSKEPVKVTRVSLKKQEARVEHFNPRNGRLEKIEIRTVRGESRFVETRIPSHKKGVPDKVMTSELPAWEFAKDGQRCKPSVESMNSLRQIGDLSDFLRAAVITGKRGNYLTTSMGVLIDSACLKLHGNEFPALLQSALHEGMACTKDLDGFGSRGNLRKISSVLTNKKNPLKFDCSETTYKRWSVATAKATLPGMQEYPKISINPTLPRPREELKNTLFHEMFHIVGYGHHVDIDYAYACGICCFEKKKSYQFPGEANVVTAGCEICKGDFEGINDPGYLRALVAFSGYNGRDIAQGAILEQIVSYEEVSDQNMKIMAEYLASNPFLYPIYSEFHSLKGAKLNLGSRTAMGPANAQLKRTSAFVAVAINAADAGKYSEALTSLETGINYLPRYDESDKSTSGYQVKGTYEFYETFISQLKKSGSKQDKVRAGALMSLIDQKKLKISK